MIMLSANSWLSLAVLVVVLNHVQALKPSLLNNKAAVDVLNDETRCSWNCTVMDSKFLEEIKTTIAKKQTIGNTFAKYEKRVTEKCIIQTSHSSSGDKQLSVFTKALESAINLTYCAKSTEEYKQTMTICTLTPISTKVTVPTYYSGSSPEYFLVRLADLGVKLDGSIDCNKQTTDNLPPCIKITKLTENNSSTFEGVPKCSSWPGHVLHCLCVVFFYVLLYYSPVFLCLFSPTDEVEDGVHQIVLDRANPVSLGSLIGNYFFSKVDTIWHRAKMFIPRVVVLPFPFLILAVFAEHLMQFNLFGVSHFLQPRMIVSYVCYYILAFCITFRPRQPPKRNRSCFLCRRVKSKTLHCQENLPKAIINHLRIQPQLIVHCWGLFIRNLLDYFETCFLLIPSVSEVSAILFVRLFLSIVLLSVSPAIIIILLIFMLLLAILAIFLTSPLSILCDFLSLFNAAPFHNRCLRLFLRFILLSLATPALLGLWWLMMLASLGGLITFLSAFVLLLSEEGLPYVACLVLVFYYLWSSYSSFTDKYQDLALELFKHYKSYKTSERSKVTDIPLNTDSLLENTQNAIGNRDSVLKIPRKLFYVACEQLMPISGSVCVLILKVTTLVSFVFLVFAVAISRNEGATPVMRTLIAFLTGSFPKIVAIYLKGGNQKKIKAMIAEERIPKIVQEYIRGTSVASQQQVNRGSDVDASANQQQVNSGSDVDASANQQHVNSGSDFDTPASQQQVSIGSDFAAAANQQQVKSGLDVDL